MLDVENSDFESNPLWDGPSAEEMGFNTYDVPHLRLKRAEGTEYLVYSTKEEFKTVEATTVMMAVEKSEIPDPVRVVPAHKRIDDVVASESLEFVEVEAKSEAAPAETAAPEEGVVSEEAAPEDAAPAE